MPMLASPTRLLAVVSIFACLSTVRADSWAPPEAISVRSRDGRFRLTVDPASAVLDPPADKDAPERPGCQKARAKLKKKSEVGGFEVVWEQPLTNRVSPVEVLVGDDGTVVTLDNWHWVGHGSNVVVIYGPDGKLVRSMGLEDFLTEEEVKELPHSVSSIWWGHGHRLDMEDETLILNVGNANFPGEKAFTKVVRVRLDSGELVEEENDPGAK
ncbi:hypothetical protein [Paludisphaera sp.]|uniref:hypothetical protein n=1 Tax=Paludisphaera sp. TaxID=2017432 RepID=UPI00301E4E6F